MYKLCLIADKVVDTHKAKIITIGKEVYVIDSTEKCYGPYTSVSIYFDKRVIIAEHKEQKLFHLLLGGSYEGEFELPSMLYMLAIKILEYTKGVFNRAELPRIIGEEHSVSIELINYSYSGWSKSTRILMNYDTVMVEGLYDREKGIWAVKPGVHSIYFDTYIEETECNTLGVEEDNPDYICIVNNTNKKCIGKNYKALVAGDYIQTDVLGRNIYLVYKENGNLRGSKIIYSDGKSDTILFEVNSILETGYLDYKLDLSRDKIRLLDSGNNLVSSIDFNKLVTYEGYIVCGRNILEIRGTGRYLEVYTVDKGIRGSIMRNKYIGTRTILFMNKTYICYRIAKGLYYAVDNEWLDSRINSIK